MEEVIVIGAGPAGLLAAWVARQRGAKVRVMASGIGTTHISPGWIQVLNESPGASLENWIAETPEHLTRLPEWMHWPAVWQRSGGLREVRELRE